MISANTNPQTATTIPYILKITDFGLSRKLGSNDAYSRTKKADFPLLSTALETLRSWKKQSDLIYRYISIYLSVFLSFHLYLYLSSSTTLSYIYLHFFSRFSTSTVRWQMYGVGEYLQWRFSFVEENSCSIISRKTTKQFLMKSWSKLPFPYLYIYCIPVHALSLLSSFLLG